MASIRRKKGSKFYYACYRGPSGTRIQESTKETNRHRAIKAAIALEEASRLRSSRDTLFASYNRISEELYAAPIRVETTRAFIEATVTQRKGEISDASARRYRQVADSFLEHLGPAADAPFRDVSFQMIVEFRSAVAERTSNSNANSYIKCLRSFFTRALSDRVIVDDPTKRLRPLAKEKRAASEKRRPFTEIEIARLLAAAEETSAEWKWMIVIGSLTGNRLGDVATMHWSNLKAAGTEIVVWEFSTSKTGREMVLPIPKSIMDQVGADLGGRAPGANAPVFPEAYSVYHIAKRAGALSNQFSDIMARAGIQAPRDHKGHKMGRKHARAASKVGYHSLRHTVTSTLTSAGEARAVVMDLVGHDSAEMSQVYTHTELLQKSAAQQKLLSLIPALGALASKSSDQTRNPPSA